MAEDSFFSRWSRRKVQAQSGEPLPPEPPALQARQAPPAASPTAAAEPVVSEAAPPAATQGLGAPAVPEPPPTLDDVARLTPQDDFKPFVAPHVPSVVRNAAVKKLFADPHFNAMDGLDIYIDDYTQPSPLSKAQMARMVGAQFLKLVDDPNAPPSAASGLAAATDPAPTAEPAPAATAASDAPATDASDSNPSLSATSHDHADLQLQPDHAPGRQSAGPGAG